MREIRTLRCDAEGAGNVARPRYWDTRRRKGEPTGETNFGLNRRASPRPYQGKPFFVPSPAIRFAERAEGVKGPKC